MTLKTLASLYWPIWWKTVSITLLTNMMKNCIDKCSILYW